MRPLGRMRPLSQEEIDEVLRRRKFKHGCLSKTGEITRRIYAFPWTWQVSFGNGIVFFGMSPAEAWNAHRNYGITGLPTIPAYRGPK